MRRLAIALLLAAAPAVAQDGSEGSAARTPEGANRFLTAIFTQDDAGTVGYDVLVKDKAIVGDDAIGAETRPVSGRMVALTPAGACKSRLELRDAQVSNGDHWPLGSFERTIDWGKVSKVEKTSVTQTDYTYDDNNQKTGERVRTLFGLWVVMRNGWQKIGLDTPSQEERDRAAFAIEFLRQGCAAGTATTAQDGSEATAQRTVESAQRFLAELVGKSGAEVQYSLGQLRVRNPKGGWWDPTEYLARWKVDRIEAPSPCVTRIYVVPGTAAVPEYDVPPPIPPIDHVDIDWSLVGPVAAGSIWQRASIYSYGLRFPVAFGGGDWVTLAYAVPADMMQRFTFAAEFLRTNCAIKSDTGF